MRGESLVERASHMALESSFDSACVVTGAYGDRVARAVRRLSVRVVFNDAWERGQSASVRTALRLAMASGFEYLAFVPVDMPFVDAAHLDALLRAARERASSAVSASSCGAMAPCVFHAAAFPALASLGGDRGAMLVARSLLASGAAVSVPFRDERMAFDVDTPEDLRMASEALSSKKGVVAL